MEEGSCDWGQTRCTWIHNSILQDVSQQLITYLRTHAAQPDFGVFWKELQASGGVLSPVGWESRRKALLTLSQGARFDYDLDEMGLMKQIRLDMGQVISAQPAKIYPNDSWDETYDNQVPEISHSQVQVEYTAHPSKAVCRTRFQSGPAGGIDCRGCPDSRHPTGSPGLHAAGNRCRTLRDCDGAQPGRHSDRGSGRRGLGRRVRCGVTNDTVDCLGAVCKVQSGRLKVKS